jgi:simple sugar transport system permease protein
MTTTSTAAGGSKETPGTARLREIPLAQRILARPAAGALLIAVFVWVVFALFGGENFRGHAGTLGYLDTAAQVGIVATAVALLMIGGEFDLSIGSLVGFAGIVIGILVFKGGWPIWAAILASMALTTGLGVINGFIVVRTGLPSFIVTLATLFLIRGLTQVMTAAVVNITYIPIERSLVAADPIAWLFNWSTTITINDVRGELRVSLFWWLLLVVAGAWLLARTRFGNWITGVGGNAQAARNLGVPVARVKITLFAMTAFSASVLAAIQSMTFFSADVLRGRGIELDAITTAVIGGSLLTGGYGSVVGTAIGAVALGMARIGIQFANINADWYLITLGTLLLVAVVLNNWIRRRFAGLR